MPQVLYNDRVACRQYARLCNHQDKEGFKNEFITGLERHCLLSGNR